MTGGWNAACPVGDPGCDAPDDGEWHSHDGCTPHPLGVITPADAERIYAAITTAAERWDQDESPAGARRPT